MFVTVKMEQCSCLDTSIRTEHSSVAILVLHTGYRQADTA
jgi:hypothetical protein